MNTSIGFAIHDAARDGRAFQIEDDGGGTALVFGTHASVRVDARGVLPTHFVLLPHEGVLLAASSDVRAPAYVGDVPIGTEWTVLEVPCRVRAGAAVIELFTIAAPAFDAETTRVGPLAQPRRGKAAVEPPVAASTTARTRIPSGQTPSLAVRAVTRLRDDYHRLSRVKRLMVPLAGLLALLAFAQPSQAGEMAPPLPGAAAPASPPSTTPPLAAELPAARARPVAPRGPLPSARSLPSELRTPLGPQERVVHHKAIEAMLAGDFQTAYRLYDALAQAHPDALDIRAAHRVLAAKIRTAR
ncbi:MAG TPA: hypothetical protein VLT33_28475 [Labilithrix sp.]|nr:hypothetical protein [Labilithrix sp.]